ncbi:MAG: serine hydrolase, partial [Victivallaceae bacterium]
SENLAALRIRDLLSMQSGFRGESSRIMAEAANPVKGFFGLDFKFKPGTEFWYDSGVSNMLSIIITKLTGQCAEAYLKSRLFEPLGIGEYSWEKDKFGNSMGGWGIAMTLEDYAKLGQLYLNGGVWNGKRLLSAEWCKQATTLQTEPDVIDRKISYGYHFRVGPEKAYHLAGMFGQFVWVFPEHNMILAIFGGNLFGPMEDKDPIWHILLPALGGEVVPENFGKNIVEKSVENLDFRRSFDTGEPLIFAPGSKVELSFEDSGKMKKINITIEQSACTVSDDGLMQRYPRGAWGRVDDSEKRDDGMNAGEVWNRAFWPASDTLLLDQLRIDGPGQLMNKIKFSKDGVAEIERIEWYDEPLKIMGRWKAY